MAKIENFSIDQLNRTLEKAEELLDILPVCELTPHLSNFIEQVWDEIAKREGLNEPNNR